MMGEHTGGALHYWIEWLPGDRGLLHADLDDDEGLITSWSVGSPAPWSSIEAALTAWGATPGT